MSRLPRYNKTNNDAIFKVAAYIRLSREDGDKPESDSIISQRDLILQFLNNKNSEFDLVEFYIDDGFSGTNFDRPKFQQLLEDINKRKINCVIVKDLSRFGRDYIETGRYLQRIFPEKHVRFISINDDIDSYKKQYDILLPLKNIFNEQYSCDISKKIISSLRTKQHNGDFIGAFATYGYLKDPNRKNKLIIDEYAAEVVRSVYNMYISGKSILGIAKILNDKDILCPSEYKKTIGLNYNNGNRLAATKYWTHCSVYRLLQNEIYLGNMIQNKSNRSRFSICKTINDKEDWIKVEGTHDAIITSLQWEQTQMILKMNTHTTDYSKNISLFAGYIICGICGRAMVKTIIYNKVFYICSTYKRYGKKHCNRHAVEEKILEDIILTKLNILIEKNLNILQILSNIENKKNYKKQNYKIKREIEKYKILLEKIHKIKKSLYEDYSLDLINKDEYLKYYKDYSFEESQLNSKIELLNKNCNEQQSIIEDNPFLQKLLKYGRIDHLNRIILANIIDKIIIYDDKIEIRYIIEKPCLF